MKSLMMLLAISMSGCVSLFTSPPPPECETRVREILTKIGEEKRCFALADPQSIAGGPDVSPSIKLTALCQDTIEVVIVLNPLDKNLNRLIINSSNMKSYGQCINTETKYDIYSTSFSLKEEKA
jgi:hypothetical protein